MLSRPKEEDSPERKSIQYFIGAGSCMESVIGSLSYQIRTMDLSDLDPQEQSILKARFEKKLADLRESSCSTIRLILGEISRSPVAEKSVYVKFLNEILSRLREK